MIWVTAAFIQIRLTEEAEVVQQAQILQKLYREKECCFSKHTASHFTGRYESREAIKNLWEELPVMSHLSFLYQSKAPAKQTLWMHQMLTEINAKCFI